MLPKIFIVEDDKSIRETLSEMLSEDYDVSAFPDGESALVELRADPVAVALVDLRLPGIDGIEVVANARKVSPETVSIIFTCSHPSSA